MAENGKVVPEAIADLSPAGADLWATITDLHPEMSEVACHILLTACQTLDRRNEARQALKQLGTTYLDRFSCPHARPEVAVERDCQALFLKSLRQLSHSLPQKDVGGPFRRMGRLYFSGQRREREA
jgi:hypothetical protein